MNELLVAVLNSNVERVRHLLTHEPELAQQRSPSGDWPIKVAKDKGLKKIEALFVRYANWEGTYSDGELKSLLVDLIAELSEDYYAAGWLDGIEFELWQLIHDVDRGPITLRIWTRRSDLESLNDLRQLMVLTESWAMWDDDAGTPVIVNMPQWQEALRRRRCL